MTRHLAHLSDNDVGIKEVRIGNLALFAKGPEGASLHRIVRRSCVLYKDKQGAKEGGGV